MGRAQIYDNRGVCATVFLDADVHARLRHDARQRGVSLSRFVNALGAAYIKAHPSAQPVAGEEPKPIPRKRTKADAPATARTPRRGPT